MLESSGLLQTILAAARLQRWALLLSAHQYEIEYQPTLKHANADCFSRLLQQGGTLLEQPGDIETLNIMQIQILPVTAKDIAKATIVDPVLSRVYQYVLNGWRNKVSEDLKPFKQRSLELTVYIPGVPKNSAQV